MSKCGGCGQRENAKEAPVVGPAVVYGNGATRTFDSDADLDRFVAWSNERRPGQGLVAVREGESL